MKIKAYWNTNSGYTEVFILGFLYTNGNGCMAVCSGPNGVMHTIPIDRLTIPEDNE